MAIHTQKGTAVEGQCHISPLQNNRDILSGLSRAMSVRLWKNSAGTERHSVWRATYNEQLLRLEQGSCVEVAPEEAI